MINVRTTLRRDRVRVRVGVMARVSVRVRGHSILLRSMYAPHPMHAQKESEAQNPN